MKKIETIWHHILHEALNNRQYKYTQQNLAKHFSYSLSTVNHALKIPSQNGAIRKTSKFFVLEDFKKLLYYCASVRNLEKDIIYQATADLSVLEIEKLVPPGSIFAGYTAAKYILKEPPADYAKVYFYLQQDQLELAKQRFSENIINKKLNIKTNNIFIFKMPECMPKYGQSTTLIQTFIDVWNFKDWYARDFIKSLQEEINVLLP